MNDPSYTAVMYDDLQDRHEKLKERLEQLLRENKVLKEGKLAAELNVARHYRRLSALLEQVTEEQVQAANSHLNINYKED